MRRNSRYRNAYILERTAVTIINTGGTFNKRYDPVSGELFVPEDNLAIESIVARFTYPLVLKGMIFKDSLQMNADDRTMLGEELAALSDPVVVIVHGTDTMDLSAEYLASLALNKVVVLTGAMVPYSIDPVEATANLSMAIGFAKAAEHKGVYICMQGIAVAHNQVKKNRETGKFERV